jgi:glutamate-1-semialdehyde 2,1-aminomutase
MRTLNAKLFQEAKRYIPGGVNSPVRSFKSVDGVPIFIKSGRGSKIYSEDGQEFIDYSLSWGALILGHSHPKVRLAVKQALENGTSFGTATKLEVDLAKLIIEAVPSIRQVRLTNSGTEAVMSAIRLARAYTKKNKIIKFEGSYHGHADYLLSKAGLGLATLGIPSSLGVPRDFTKHTITLPFNNINNLEQIARKYQKDLAAIIVEPVMANCGVILPEQGFLEELRRVANKYHIVLIFDEVITGFRVSYGGAQGFFKVQPDLTCLGKIVGGGLPMGAFGGRKTIMQLLSPVGNVYQAGTFSGNPIAVTAGITTLNILKKNSPYEKLERNTKQLCEQIELKAKSYNIKLRVNYIASMFSIFFTNEEVKNYTTATRQSVILFKKLFHALLKKGIYFSPSSFETDFLSTAHTNQDIEKVLNVIDKTLKELRRI